MVRSPYIDENGLKKGAWSKEEDNKLSAYINRYGHWNWNKLPRFAGLNRCGKSCRLRWMNYLKPGVRRGNYTQEEDELILKLHQEFGSRWALIASELPGRTDNDIKNHWHTNLRGRVKPKPESMDGAGETSVRLEVDNQEDFLSNNSTATSDARDDTKIGTAGNVILPSYHDPAAALIKDIGNLDWADLAKILSPVEQILMNPSGEDFWSQGPASFNPIRMATPA